MTVKKITITEALAEANNEKLIDRKVNSEIETVLNFLWRPQALADRLSEQGGEVKNVRQKMQSITDLLERKLTILTAVKRANSSNSIVLAGVERTIEEWLIWRQYIAPKRKQYLERLIRKIDEGRQTAMKQGGAIVEDKNSAFSPNVIINVDEIALRDELTKIQETLDMLDGQLSLKNATITITV